MRRLLGAACGLFLAVATVSAQGLTPSALRRIAESCAPGADFGDLLAIARTESGLYPWALSVNYPEAAARRLGYSSGRMFLRRQPTSKEEGVRWAHELQAAGFTVSVGLLQVSAERSGYSIDKLLTPCDNLRIGWSILLAAYRRAASRLGPGQPALLTALGAYNAGQPEIGLKNGYVFSVLSNR